MPENFAIKNKPVNIPNYLETNIPNRLIFALKSKKIKEEKHFAAFITKCPLNLLMMLDIYQNKKNRKGSKGFLEAQVQLTLEKNLALVMY